MRLAYGRSYLSVTWCCGWADPESDIETFWVSFGTSPGVRDELDWTNVGSVLSYTHYAHIPDGDHYACVVAQVRAPAPPPRTHVIHHITLPHAHCCGAELRGALVGACLLQRRAR